jgi:hypothetical protein
MRRRFKYSKGYVLFNYLSLAFIPALIFAFFFLIIGDAHIFPLTIFLFCLLISIVIVTRMINILKTELIVDDTGIKYSTLFRRRFIGWDQILNISKKDHLRNTLYLQKHGSRWNLEVKTKENKVIKIYYFLKGMKDFITEIEKHVQFDNYIFVSRGYLLGNDIYRKLYFLKIGLGLLVSILIVLFTVADHSIKTFFIIVLLIVASIAIIFYKRILTIHILADSSGIILDGFPSWRSVKHLPWNIIKSVKIEDKNKGPLIIETSTDQISLWNFTNVDENSRIIKLIEEKIRNK